MEFLSEHFLPVHKTARVFTLGRTGNHIKEVWLVLHGYAQLAQSFIENFKILEAPQRLIIAPEGLNHFYAKGFGGKPAASWMTSEMREHEIKDYIAYINKVCETFIHSDTKLILFGFSQGVATASRWLNQCIIPVSLFVIYSGELAAELVHPTIANKLISTPLVYVTGNKDPLITPEKHQEVKTLMLNLDAYTIVFDGGHELKPEILNKLTDWV